MEKRWNSNLSSQSISKTCRMLSDKRCPTFSKPMNFLGKWRACRIKQWSEFKTTTSIILDSRYLGRNIWPQWHPHVQGYSFVPQSPNFHDQTWSCIVHPKLATSLGDPLQWVNKKKIETVIKLKVKLGPQLGRESRPSSSRRSDIWSFRMSEKIGQFGTSPSWALWEMMDLEKGSISTSTSRSLVFDNLKKCSGPHAA